MPTDPNRVGQHGADQFCGGQTYHVRRLGASECSCLALVQAELFVSDDLDARSAAQCLGISTTDTAGILALVVKRKLLSLQAAQEVLTALIAPGYHSPLDRLDSLLPDWAFSLSG